MLECPVCKEFVENNEKCSVCGFEYVERLDNESELDYLKRAYLYKRHHKDVIKKKGVSKQLPKETGDPLSKDILDLTCLSNETTKAYLRNTFDRLYAYYEQRRKHLLSQDAIPKHLTSFFGYDRLYPLKTMCSDKISYYLTNDIKTEGLYYGPKGAVYKGGLSNWKFHGKGELHYDNKDYFIGAFVQGNREGVGELTIFSTKEYYYGNYKNNKIVDYYYQVFENKAVRLTDFQSKEHMCYEEIRYNEGSIFVGKKQNLLGKGKGLYVASSGDHYFGSIKDGSFEGFGRFYYVNKNIYVGEFVKGERHGNGTFIWPDGQYYQGEFVKNYRQGYGEYHWVNGAYYKGEWHKGKRHGQGEYHYSDGSVYIGDWKENARHGQGQLTKENGEILNGLWENDEFKG